jgi:hypothetical protein
MFLATGCREFAGAAIPATSTPPASMRILDTQEYRVRLQLTLVNEGPGKPEKQNLWIALISTFAPYQEVLSMEIAPKQYTMIVDEYGNRFAEFDFSDHPPGASKVVEIEYLVRVNELAYDLSTCQGEMLDEFTQPELHIESANTQIKTLAADLSQGKQSACQQVRAFYDFVGDELVYSFNGEQWGAQAALGPMGADCTEYAALLVALSRSQGIPARYFEGLLYPKNDTGAPERFEHAWADVFLPGSGWAPMDPTLGRSSIFRETYFAHYTPDHIIVTLGASPSTLRGSSYWTHLYWPGNSTQIHIDEAKWEIEPIDE